MCEGERRSSKSFMRRVTTLEEANRCFYNIANKCLCEDAGSAAGELPQRQHKSGRTAQNERFQFLRGDVGCSFLLIHRVCLSVGRSSVTPLSRTLI